MLRICRRCRSEYNGDPGSTLCPSCVREGRRSTIRDRLCRTCGVTFPGGPRAWYCPDCRADRQKAQSRDYHRRKTSGKTRSIGSEDLCEICGKPYTVASGRQRYCPDCAPAAIAEADRQQGRAWYAANADPDGRRELRKSHTAELKCVVCGRPYKPTDASTTCSPACSAELHKRTASAWEKDHRAERNQYHRGRRNNQKEDYPMYTCNSNLRPAQHLSDPADIAIRIIYDTVDDGEEDWPSDRCAEIEAQITALAIGESITIDDVTVTR